MVAATLTACLTKLNSTLSGKRYKPIKHLTGERLSALANIKANLRQHTNDDDDSRLHSALHNQLQVLGPSMLEPFKQSLIPDQSKLCVAVLDLLGRLAHTPFFYWKASDGQDNLCDLIVNHIANGVAETEDTNVLLAVSPNPWR
ncbi:hypothetical protein GNI_176340 [Gregarina niphandrodes]|uniref:Uncharacterized protein n=1 Tax=Gregarina niphandrodes TaxID=110365 RepID=A0A023AYI2_GRENI|nr:hypothetical protein GNI_176340 [Gregarina niphandrodes]EZG43340.1 hypothetical protein GNI_176340 [Gregarina niphandrodes]|eukprot:XP_011133411.1 hypothetical protein GNI_176340 [Gregarina niphandrodes]